MTWRFFILLDQAYSAIRLHLAPCDPLCADLIDPAWYDGGSAQAAGDDRV